MVITMHGARRWLIGDSFPTQSHLNALASLLGVSSAWLLLGQGPMLEEAVSVDAVPASHNNLGEVLGIFQSLKDSERQLVLNLMMTLNRSHSHST
jgi:phage repressor protein C with HTH and peptisase S24 domain